MTQRKLTTIFAADVQGYSRLMEADEEGTLATLKQYREAMGRLIESHGGRVVNTWGDGLLADFPSVVEAVRTAVDVQNELAERNAGRATATRMQFRIGINLGDVIVEGDDIYGDGVNIAARLQTQAPAGGVVISNTVYDQVRNKVAVGFEFLGNLNVKNIEEGVPSYSIRIGEQEAESQPARQQFGRAATMSAPAQPAAPARQPFPRVLMGLAIVACALAVINLLSWSGSFWAAWPILVVVVLGALSWSRSISGFDRGISTLAVLGLGLVAINLLTWSGVFWAKWPLLVFAVMAGVRLAMRSRGDARLDRQG